MCQELSYFLEERICISLVWALNWNKLSSEEAQVWTPHKTKEQCSSGPTVIWGWQLVFHCWFCCIYWLRVKLLLSYSGVKDGRQISALRGPGSKETTTTKKILHMKGSENTGVCRALPFFWSKDCIYDDYFLSWSNPVHQRPWLHLSTRHTRISEWFFQDPGMEQPSLFNTWNKAALWPLRSWEQATLRTEAFTSWS